MMGLYGANYHQGQFSIGTRDVEDLESSWNAVLVYSPSNPLECDGNHPSYQAGRHLAEIGKHNVFFTTCRDPNLSEYADLVIVGHDEPDEEFVSKLAGNVHRVNCDVSRTRFLLDIVGGAT